MKRLLQPKTVTDLLGTGVTYFSDYQEAVGSAGFYSYDLIEDIVWSGRSIVVTGWHIRREFNRYRPDDYIDYGPIGELPRRFVAPNFHHNEVFAKTWQKPTWFLHKFARVFGRYNGQKPTFTVTYDIE